MQYNQFKKQFYGELTTIFTFLYPIILLTQCQDKTLSIGINIVRIYAYGFGYRSDLILIVSTSDVEWVMNAKSTWEIHVMDSSSGLYSNNTHVVCVDPRVNQILLWDRGSSDLIEAGASQYCFPFMSEGQRFHHPRHHFPEGFTLLTECVSSCSLCC